MAIRDFVKTYNIRFDSKGRVKGYELYAGMILARTISVLFGEEPMIGFPLATRRVLSVRGSGPCKLEDIKNILENETETDTLTDLVVVTPSNGVAFAFQLKRFGRDASRGSGSEDLWAYIKKTNFAFAQRSEPEQSLVIFLENGASVDTAVLRRGYLSEKNRWYFQRLMILAVHEGTISVATIFPEYGYTMLDLETLAIIRQRNLE